MMKPLASPRLARGGLLLFCLLVVLPAGVLPSRAQRTAARASLSKWWYVLVWAIGATPTAGFPKPIGNRLPVESGSH